MVFGIFGTVGIWNSWNLGWLAFGIVGFWNRCYLRKRKEEKKSEISGILRERKIFRNLLVFGIIVGLIEIIGRLRRNPNSLCLLILIGLVHIACAFE